MAPSVRMERLNQLRRAGEQLELLRVVEGVVGMLGTRNHNPLLGKEGAAPPEMGEQNLYLMSP